MMKQSTFLLLFTLFFTACVERTQTLQPNINTSMAKPIIAKKNTKKVPAKTTPVLKVNTIKKVKTPIVTKTETVVKQKKVIDTPSEEITSNENKSFFAWSDETKNKISGFFVIIIGIMILI